MADSALGSALVIPQEALNKIKEADEKLEKIQRTAEQTASSVNNSFLSMASGANYFIDSLNTIISKLGTIRSGANGMKGSLDTLGADKAASNIERMSGAIMRAAENIERLIRSENAEKMAEEVAAKYAEILAEKRMQAEEKVAQAKIRTQEEIAKTEAADIKLANTITAIEMQKQKAIQLSGKQQQESAKARTESVKAEQEEIKVKTAEINKSAEATRSIIAENKATREKIKQKTEEVRVQSETVKNQTAQAKLSVEEARLKKAEAQAHLTNAQAIAKEARANELIEKAQQKTANSNNKATNFSDFKGVISQYANASSLREHSQAVKDLKQARLSLITTDSNYKQNLASVNEAINHHTKVLREAGVSAKQLGEQTSYLSGYMSRWAQRMAFAFSVDSIKSFVNQIAEVRGQFELSQRSLEAILQNKPKADEIFNKTVELAVKSPFRIKDLVDYTRQLSAYRIESDKLYDTTKRLADVSAGLGVDMGRLILAYGQVKAAAYLRGSEVRQFTEAGINMYGELQEYFKEVKGEAYTTAQIVDMISKRKVAFEDVEAIFQRMTDRGGTFYNMQEIQAETLQGKISNLKDAFDVMLNEMGKANEGTMKGMISGATALLKHWESISTVIKSLVGVLVLLQLQSIRTGVGLSKVFSTVVASNATKSVTLMQLLKNSLKSAGETAVIFGKNLKTAIASNAWLIAFAAVAQTLWSIGEAWYDYKKKVKVAQEETIKTQGAISVIASSYDQLAKSASNANDKLKGNDLEKNINDRRAALQKLVDLASKDGLVFKINVDTIKNEELDAKFKEIKDKYKKFVDDIEVIERNYAKNDNWNTYVTDGLDDDANDYKDAVIDVLSMSSQMEQAVAVINANYDKANKSTKKYFDIIREGQKDGESNIDYWKRMKDAIQQINRFSTYSSYASPEWASNVQSVISDMIQGINKVDKKAGELAKEFDAVFGDLRTKYNNDPIAIQAVIDKVAAKHDWSQYEKDLAYHHFGIDVYINKGTTENEVSWVDEYLTNYFAKKKFGINLVVKEITDEDALDELIKKGDQAAKAAKNWKELEKRMKTIGKNQKQIKVDDSIRKVFPAGDPRIGGEYIDVSTVLQMIKEYKKAALDTAKNGFGVNPFEKDDKKSARDAAKEQRDILQERISLLKEMNSEYHKLIKIEGDEQAVKDIRKHFALSAKNVGMNINDFIPDRQTVAKKIEEFASQYKELTKRSSAYKSAADIRIGIDEEYFKQQLDDAKSNAQEAFSKLELFKKLKEDGLSDSIIKTMFGELTTSFADVRKSITDDFEAKWGKDQTKWGENAAKEYQEQMDKLDKQIYQDQVNQAQELIKAYKQRLTDQLQLDRWYISECNKLQTNENISKDKELQKQLQENLDAQYKKKTDENTWKDFQNSDMYVRLFDSIEQVSTKALNAMAERLQQLRGELKSLDATQVKAITEQLNKVNEIRNSRNPFKAFTAGLKEMAKASKDLKKLGGVDKYVKLNSDKADLTTKLQSQNAYVELLQKEYETIENNGQAESENGKALKLKLATNKQIRDSMKSQLKLTDAQIEKLGIVMAEEEQAKSKFSKSVTDITSVVSTMATAFNGLFEALGGQDEQLENVLGIVDNIGQAIGSYYSGNYAGVVAGAMGALTGIAKIFTNDGKINREIEKQERVINSLQHAYEKLKKSMDEAFDIQRLYEYSQKSIETLKAEQKSYEAMIKAEQSRKNPDSSKIQEWSQQIEDITDTIKELNKTLTEELGGFGSEVNYKSAASAFADAWVSAFNEGSDALDALNDKFDEYIQNLITKQATQRIVGRLMEPLLKMVDESVSEGSEGGNDGLELTRDELAKIKDRGAEVTKAINEALLNLSDVLEYKPKGNSNISALQQGIQSITESTGQALESVLNSVRYYVATQQADVRIIRDTLIERLGTAITAVQQDTSSSPILVELRLQTSILTDIRDTLMACVKSGHKAARKGIAVFMN